MIITPPPLVLNLGLTLSFVGFTTSSGTTISPHASAAVGDIAILFDYTKTNGGGDPGNVVPTGWTSVATVAGSDSRYTVSRKVLAGTGSVTGMSGSHGSSKIMLIFRPSAAVSVTDQDIDNQYVATSAGSSTASAGSGAVPLIILGWHGAHSGSNTINFSSISPNDMTTVRYAPLRTGGGAYLNNNVAYLIVADSPADHTVSNASGQNNMYVGSFYQEAAAA